jgi:molybdopterin-guanine dinucleotide biosynthesis protein B
VAFVGGHDSGKTTLLVELVPWLTAMGFKVGAIKHTSKDAEDDVSGKDSHRHATSGAAISAFVTPGRTTARRLGPEEPLEDLLAREFSDCDVVLIEGYKSLLVPKVEVTRAGARPPIEGVLARVSDRPADDAVPTHAFATSRESSDGAASGRPRPRGA